MENNVLHILCFTAVQKEWALASTVFFLVTVVSNIVIYWWPYPVAEILSIPQFRLSVYWWLPQALQFPISCLTRWDLFYAFGTRLRAGSYFLKGIWKVPPPLTQHLAKSKFRRRFLCSACHLLIMGCSLPVWLLFFLQDSVKHSPVRAFTACNSSRAG